MNIDFSEMCVHPLPTNSVFFFCCLCLLYHAVLLFMPIMSHCVRLLL